MYLTNGKVYYFLKIRNKFKCSDESIGWMCGVTIMLAHSLCSYPFTNHDVVKFSYVSFKPIYVVVLQFLEMLDLDDL